MQPLCAFSTCVARINKYEQAHVLQASIHEATVNCGRSGAPNPRGNTLHTYIYTYVCVHIRWPLYAPISGTQPNRGGEKGILMVKKKCFCDLQSKSLKYCSVFFSWFVEYLIRSYKTWLLKNIYGITLEIKASKLWKERLMAELGYHSCEMELHSGIEGACLGYDRPGSH